MEIEKPVETQIKQQDIQEEQKVPEITEAATPEVSEKAEQNITYTCKGCRRFLFNASEIVEHNSGTKKFKTTTKKKFVSIFKN